MIGDQEDLWAGRLGATAWRTLDETPAAGGAGAGRDHRRGQRRPAPGLGADQARHATSSGIRVADKTLEGVTCIRLDASVVTCHSDKEGAEPNLKGFGLHPLLAYCDNTARPLTGTLRPGSAGSNTATDHLAVLDAAIRRCCGFVRRRLMITCDGAGASHDDARLDKAAQRPGSSTPSAGAGKRDKAAVAPSRNRP